MRRPQIAPVLARDAVVLREDVLEHHDPGGAGGGVAAVVADVAAGRAVVLVRPLMVVVVLGPVGMAVETAHQASASSSDTTANSSPESKVTSRL